ncbi:F0F1 ATP synthase subunit delta [Clostridium sp. MB40-C1]|uniref:F0F1 ATP synthase subunit delta n=1 Tax=Clostridium sp. MB40-C1 TaxID=3070996 RepID=UPI0027E0FBF0|nr:F0F1 ATP synthase subunit delta [Clostridium sp. MB40-C1]WMJ79672.1 F0F1 ATP synthase subunit delta [Clostridium sp. MB40-C1]
MYEYLDRRYALALYEVAKEKDKVEEYIQEGKEIIELLEGNEEIQKIIRHPEISTSRKKELFTEIFKDKIYDDLLSFMLLLIEKDRILYMKEKIKQMEKIHLQNGNKLVAHVKTVIPLNAEEKKELIKKLENKYRKTIILKEEIDKNLIGGVYVRVGDDVIDGSIRSKFEEINELVLSN